MTRMPKESRQTKNKITVQRNPSTSSESVICASISSKSSINSDSLHENKMSCLKSNWTKLTIFKSRKKCVQCQLSEWRLIMINDVFLYIWIMEALYCRLTTKISSILCCMESLNDIIANARHSVEFTTGSHPHRSIIALPVVSNSLQSNYIFPFIENYICNECIKLNTSSF